MYDLKVLNDTLSYQTIELYIVQSICVRSPMKHHGFYEYIVHTIIDYYNIM